MDRPRVWGPTGIDLSKQPVLRIGCASIDPLSREASFPGGAERLQPQNLKVLIALARRAGEVVTREELIERCWDGRIIGDDVINHAISVLRSFAERATGFSIETVPKAGYRLIEANGAPPRRRGWMVATAAGVALLGIVAWLVIGRPLPNLSEPSVPTVALLSFVVPSGDPLLAEVGRQSRATLSHMMTESGLPPRLSADAANRSDLRVAGDIKRAAGQVEMLVRIEDRRSGAVIFTRSFSAPEAEASRLADQVGAYVATNLSWTSALMILDRRDNADPRLTGELLRQLAIVVEGEGDILRAYQISRDVADKLPNSAIAQLSLAMNSGFAVFQMPSGERLAAIQRGRMAAARSKQLAPHFGDVYLSDCSLYSQVRIAVCEAAMRTAMRIDPDAPFVTAFLSSQLMEAGRFEQALAFARMSIAADPYKTAKLYRMLALLDLAGRPEEAKRLRADADRWWPANPRIRWGKIDALLLTGQFEGLRGRPELTGEAAPQVDVLVTAWQARDRLSAEKVCGEPDVARLPAQLCILMLPQLGSRDLAFKLADPLFPDLLGRTLEEQDHKWLRHESYVPTTLLSMPSAAALRTDPRFLELARRIGLLAYWREVALPDFCTKAREPVCDRIRPRA